MARKNPLNKIKDAAKDTLSTATDVGLNVAGQVSRTAVGLAGEAVEAVRSRVAPDGGAEAKDAPGPVPTPEPASTTDGPASAGAASSPAAKVAQPAKKTAAKKTAAKKTAAKKTAAKKTAAKKTAAEKTATTKTATKKTATTKAATKKSAAKKTATKKTAPTTATPADIADNVGTDGPAPETSPGAKLPPDQTDL